MHMMRIVPWICCGDTQFLFLRKLCPFAFLMYRKHLPDYKTKHRTKTNKGAVFSGKYFWDSALLLRVSVIHSFCLLRAILFYGFTKIYLSIHQLLVFISLPGLECYVDMCCKYFCTRVSISVDFSWVNTWAWACWVIF